MQMINKTTAELISIANDGTNERWALAQAELKRREARGELSPAQIAQAKGQSVNVAPAVTAPFDPRSEISADARHISGRIVTHLWIIFVLLPMVLGILFEILKHI